MTIRLNMIVKDEAAVIERCLRSVLPIIDSWSIVDTGSTDGTQDIIRTVLADVPGVLHERPWVNFGHNRTQALKLAGSDADWLLMLDADMTIEYDAAMVEGLVVSPWDAHMLRYAGGETEHWTVHLVRPTLSWEFVGETHEYIHAASGASRAPFRGITIHHHADGGCRADKFERDLALLTQAVEDDPSNTRSVFYLAQTQRDLGMTDEAIRSYLTRATMGGWDEEVYYSLLQAGVLSGSVDLLLRAWSDRPSRLEALYEAAHRLRGLGAHHAAHTLLDAQEAPQTPPDVLFVQPWVYEYGIRFERALAAHNVGDADVDLLYEELLDIESLPDAYREAVHDNLRLLYSSRASEVVGCNQEGDR